MHLDPAHVLVFVLLGGVFGFAGGLFGIGGATLAIPTLGIAFGMTEQLAQGTSLVMALPNVVAGLWRYAQKAGLDWRAGALLAISGLPSTYAGAVIATSLASRPLRIGFAIFLILIALDIGRRALQKGEPTRKIVLPWPYAAVVGLVCGIFSGFFGIGGAIVLVPAMTMFFGWTIAIPLAIGGVFAVRYGVDVAHRLPERELRLSFVVFVICVGVALLVKG